MARFDPKAYEEAVVKPLRRWSGRELPDDLVGRYAIDLTMSDAELAARLGEVRSQWHKGAQSTGKPASVRSVYKAFLRADEELRRTHGEQMTKLAWWQRHTRARADARRPQITELAQTLRASFGDLGLIAAGQLEATMRAAYGALTPAEVDRALAEAGVRRSTPLELPTASGLPDTTYRTLRDNLVDAEVGSIPALIHGSLTRFWALESFRSEPAHPELTAGAVRAAVDRENRRSGNHPARAALGILHTAAKDGVDLRVLTVFHLLDSVRRLHADGAVSRALVKQLVQAGLDEDEARLAVFSVLNESAATPVAGLAAVRALLAEGRLVGARQAVATVPGTDDAAEARALVDRQRNEVRQLRDAALAALRAGDEQEATHRLQQARALAVDDQDIAAELRRIPPPPVLGLSVVPAGVDTRVSWRPAPGHQDGTRYRLVRKPARTPEDPADGVTVGEGDATVLVDAAAPAATLLGYAVFASVDGGPWSRPAGATIEMLPPVHDVRLTVDEDGVAARWQVHPEVSAVEVRRRTGAGTEAVLRGVGTTRFHDGAPVDDGGPVYYTLVARYRRADGSEGSSPPVTVRAVRQGHLPTVSALGAEPVRAERGYRVRLTWQHPPDHEVVIRRASQPVPWPVEDVVPLAEFARYGKEVRGRVTDRAGWRTLVADVPSGVFHYVPFTVGPAGAVRGQDTALGIAPAVTGLRQQRLGAELVLSWEWPDGVGVAEVRWTGGGGSGRRLLTRNQYLTEGGCRVRCGTDEVAVRVRGVVHTAGGDCVSADERLTVPPRPPSISYTVAMSRRPLVGGGTVRVKLTADGNVPTCTLVVVAARGVVMPRRPADGHPLLRRNQGFHAGQEVELSAALPRLRRPYWVRCFLDDPTDDGCTGGAGGAVPARLIDPPTAQLKVS
jgi:hypothetical protein